MDYLSLVECKRQVITADWFTPDLLTPDCQKYLKVGRDTVTRQWVIQTEAYVGVIPLTAEYGIQIRPKSELRNLTYMLYRSGLLNRSLETPFKQTVPYDIPDDGLKSFFEGLISSFLESLDGIKRWGLIRASVLEQENAYAVRGRIDYQQWIRRLPQTNGLPIPQQIFNTRIDNLPNRVLRRCLEYLVSFPLKYVPRDDVLARLEYFNQLAPSFVSQQEVDELEHDLVTGHFPSSRYYYLPALNLAFLIFRGAGLGLGENQDVTFKPLLINTADMFEKYIRVLFQETVQALDARAEDGKQNPLKFYREGPQPIFIQPDVLIRYGGSTVFVADVKYKFAPTPQDHYQLWSYMQAHQVKRGGFVSLAQAERVGNKNPAWFKREDYAVFDYAFDCFDIASSERQLQSIVSDLTNDLLL